MSNCRIFFVFAIILCFIVPLSANETTSFKMEAFFGTSDIEFLFFYDMDGEKPVKRHCFGTQTIGSEGMLELDINALLFDLKNEGLNDLYYEIHGPEGRLSEREPFEFSLPERRTAPLRRASDPTETDETMDELVVGLELGLAGEDINFIGNNFGLGTSTPGYKLDVTRDIGATGDYYGNIHVNDTRSTNSPPSAYDKEVAFDFKSRATVGVGGSGTYSGLITMAPWGDDSGDMSHQLNLNNSGLFWRTGWPNSASWGSWYRIWTQNTDGAGSGLDADLLDGLHASSFASTSHSHANLTPGTGLIGSAYNGSTARTWSVDFGNSSTGGTRAQGNFGQFYNHSTYSDFNSTPGYWGWNYVSGATNAPNALSSQWYRNVVSLGGDYPARGTGGYSMELAFPRYNHNTAGVWMRTVENGSIGGWTRIDGGASHTGSGTTNYLARWTGSTSLGNGITRDDGTWVGIGTAPSASRRLGVYASGSGTGIYAYQTTGSADVAAVVAESSTRNYGYLAGTRSTASEPFGSFNYGVYGRVEAAGWGGFGGMFYNTSGNWAALAGDASIGYNYAGYFNGDIYTTGNHYVSRMYDRNNTAYYSDPASTSHFNDMRASIYYDRDNTTYYANPASTSNFNDLRARIFYDLDNTSYYVNPNSTSNMYTITANANIYNSGWYRGGTADNGYVRLFGNTRQMVFRTDGTTQYSDNGAYPFVWLYAGDASGDRRMILSSSGQLWLSNYGWLHDYISSHGDNLGNHTATTTLNMSNREILNTTNYNTTAGDGYGLRFWGSDSYKIYMSSTGNGTWGGRLDGTSDYNMYFRMTGGTNRGFVFRNNTTNVVQIESSGALRLSNDLIIDGNTVIDDGGGWHRSYGNTGWYNGTYGGGWYMTDANYIRNYNSKQVYLNANLYAPLMYDQNNTSFYLDPASTSNMNVVRASIVYDRDNLAYYSNPASTSIYNDLRANIFYDQGNTSYYLNPYGPSRLQYTYTQYDLPWSNGSYYLGNSSYRWGTAYINGLYLNGSYRNSWPTTGGSSYWTDGGSYLYPNGGIGTNLRIADIQNYNYGFYSNMNYSDGYGSYNYVTYNGYSDYADQTGVYGYGNYSYSGTGWGWYSTQRGVYGYGNNTGGAAQGVYGYANGYNSYGSVIGVYGYSADPSGSNWGAGGYFYNGYTGRYEYVAGNYYAHYGYGTKSCVMETEDYGVRALACIESPEVLFQDFGISKLDNGSIEVNLDPILLQVILVDDDHPMKVFITPGEGCENPIRATVKQDGTGFIAEEMNKGKSDGEFFWMVVATKDDDHAESFRFEDMTEITNNTAEEIKREMLKLYLEHGERSPAKFGSRDLWAEMDEDGITQSEESILAFIQPPTPGKEQQNKEEEQQEATEPLFDEYGHPIPSDWIEDMKKAGVMTYSKKEVESRRYQDLLFSGKDHSAFVGKPVDEKGYWIENEKDLEDFYNENGFLRDRIGNYIRISSQHRDYLEKNEIKYNEL